VSTTERTIDVTMEIDADVSIRTSVLDVTWQKRQSGCDVRASVGCTPIRQPTDASKHQHQDDEDFDKRVDDLITIRRIHLFVGSKGGIGQ